LIFTGKGKQKISGWHLARLRHEGVGAKLTLLSEMRLIESTTRSDIEGASEESLVIFSIHPAVRDGFLRSLDTESTLQGHEAAREGLEAALGRHTETNPSDPAVLDLLEEIVYHTLEAGQTQEAWEIHQRRIGGFKNLGWRLGAFERGERICRAFAGGRPPQTAPLLAGMSFGAQAVFINQWGLYLHNLGRVDAAVTCFERDLSSTHERGDWKAASRINQNLASSLLTAGRRRAGLAAAEEALNLAERADDKVARCNSYGYRGFAKALCGDSEGALLDFCEALKWQIESEGRPQQPLYSLRGIQHNWLVARLGRNTEAMRLTEGNKIACGEFAGQGNTYGPRCNLLMADLAVEGADCSRGKELLIEAKEWGIARDAKEVLCLAGLVGARIALAEFGNAKTKDHLNDARVSVESGLRIATDCGYGIHHIDLLLIRVRIHLLCGDVVAAEEDIRTALERGIHPPADSGRPELLAATDPECGYAWGEAEALHLLAQAMLLRAAQALKSADFVPGRFKSLPPGVRSLIDAARGYLENCVALRRKIQDAKLKDTEALLGSLDEGILTEYPLEAKPMVEERREVVPVPGAELQEDQRMTKKHVFLSYCRDNKVEVTKLRDDLIAAGEPVWWDGDILPGDFWRQAIKQAMKDSYAVVLCVSRETQARAQTGIYPEARDAITEYRKMPPGALYLIPVRMSDCEVPDFPIDDMMSLNDIQHVDLYPPAERADGLTRLLTSLRRAPEHP